MYTIKYQQYIASCQLMNERNKNKKKSLFKWSTFVSVDCCNKNDKEDRKHERCFTIIDFTFSVSTELMCQCSVTWQIIIVKL